MQRRQINDKFKEVYSAIEKWLPEHLRVGFIEGTFIAGSSISSLFFDEEPNDYDIYCLDEGTASELSTHFKKKKAFMTDSAASLKIQGHPVQLIFKKGFIGKPEDVVDRFDFQHTMAYWSPSTRLKAEQDTLEAILTRELRYTGTDYPLSALFRTRKFIKRGWSINAGEMLKACLDLRQHNLHDLQTLVEQLAGVDIAYFGPLIEKLEEDPSLVASPDLFDIITKLFEETPTREEEREDNDIDIDF